MTVTLRQVIERMNELKEKQTELEAMVKSFEEQETEFPKNGDVVYVINALGEVFEAFYKCETDKGSFSIGNIFRTKEEAKFAVEQFKVIAEMKRCGGVFIDKHNRDEYFFLTRLRKDVYIGGTKLICETPSMFFNDYDSALKALNTIGEERLLKYWFCVEVEE
jgi:hypothetical protein